MAQSLSTLQSAALAPVLAVTGVNPSVAPATLTFPAGALAADPAGGQTVTITGGGFNDGVAVYINTTQCSTTYGNSNSLTFTTPATSAGLYNIVVYNTDGTNGTKPAGIRFEPLPVWVTSSGALPAATADAPYSTTVSATGTGITYSVTSGSLPTGLSLNSSTGAITGTPTSANTFNFTISAINAYNQTTPRAFSINVVQQVMFDYLVVAGGGAGGGYYNSGGGGAGGLLTGSNVTLDLGVTITCTVGGGATGTQGFVLRGSNSSISATGLSTVTAIGGGGGGSYVYTGNVVPPGGGGLVEGGAGQGGSGGGSSGYVITASYFAPGVYPGSSWISAPRQGYDGNVGGQYGAGGGGGAGQAGSKGGASNGGNGGNGVQSSITGTAVYYAGGGGGAAYAPGAGPTAGTGGLGGGGAGATYAPGGPYSGNVNTGGGGGGASNYYPGTGTGGNGGSGVVILRTLSNAASTTGSPTITTDGAYKVYTFTQTGTITF